MKHTLRHNRAMIPEDRDKVKAIKGLRGLTGYGLKEAKDIVEEAFAGNPVRITVLSRAEINKGAYTYEGHVNMLTEGGCILVNTRSDVVDTICEDLKHMVKVATEHECYAIGRDILEVLNKHDRRQNNKKRSG